MVKTLKVKTGCACAKLKARIKDEYPTSPIDADRPKKLGGRVKGAPRWATKTWKLFESCSWAAPDLTREEADQLNFLEDRIRVAKVIFSLDAVLGILSIGGAALYGGAYSSEKMWPTFWAILVPGAVLWALFCYGAYKGLTSENVFLKFVFLLNVVGNAFGFPVGTAIAGVSIWLWRDLRK